LAPKVFTTITFHKVDSKMVILPGDVIKTRFITDSTDQEAIRIMPEIYDPLMPSPMKERYQTPNRNMARLPCDDRKVADTIVCTDYTVHCTDPNDRIMFNVQGSGEIYTIDKKCWEFMEEYQNWGEL